MPYSSGEGFRTGDPRVNSALLPTGDPTLETTVARIQLPVGPQPQLSSYDVSTARFFAI